MGREGSEQLNKRGRGGGLEGAEQLNKRGRWGGGSSLNLTCS